MFYRTGPKVILLLLFLFFALPFARPAPSASVHPRPRPWSRDLSSLLVAPSAPSCGIPPFSWCTPVLGLGNSRAERVNQPLRLVTIHSLLLRWQSQVTETVQHPLADTHRAVYVVSVHLLMAPASAHKNEMGIAAYADGQKARACELFVPDPPVPAQLHHCARLAADAQ